MLFASTLILYKSTLYFKILYVYNYLYTYLLTLYYINIDSLYRCLYHNWHKQRYGIIISMLLHANANPNNAYTIHTAKINNVSTAKIDNEQKQCHYHAHREMITN